MVHPMGSTANGADDGIRTRDPNLGKVLTLVFAVIPSRLRCGSVHLVSTESTESRPVVERSTRSPGPRPTAEGRLCWFIVHRRNQRNTREPLMCGLITPLPTRRTDPPAGVNFRPSQGGKIQPSLTASWSSVKSLARSWGSWAESNRP